MNCACVGYEYSVNMHSPRIDQCRSSRSTQRSLLATLAVTVLAFTTLATGLPSASAAPTTPPGYTEEQLKAIENEIANDFDPYDQLNEASASSSGTEATSYLNGQTISTGPNTRQKTTEAPIDSCSSNQKTEGEQVCVQFGGAVPAEIREELEQSRNARAESTDLGCDLTFTAGDALSVPPGSNYYMLANRYQVCLSTVWNMVRTQGALTVGHASGYATMVFKADPGVAKVSQTLNVKTHSSSGNTGTMTLKSTAYCTGCRTERDTPLNFTNMTAGATGSGKRVSFVDVPTSGTSVQLKTAKMSIRMDAYVLGSIKATINLGPGDARCDRNLSRANTQACVFHKIEGRHKVAAANQESYYNHLKNAKDNGVQGFFRGITPPLTYTKNGTISNANRAKACVNNPKPAPRPAGKTCDEYPFASTNQGSAGNPYPMGTQPGCSMTDPIATISNGRSSRCWITDIHNARGGGYLSAFYASQRMAEGDPFRVELI